MIPTSVKKQKRDSLRVSKGGKDDNTNRKSHQVKKDIKKIDNMLGLYNKI